jgi:hypothetical protein
MKTTDLKNEYLDYAVAVAKGQKYIGPRDVTGKLMYLATKFSTNTIKWTAILVDNKIGLWFDVEKNQWVANKQGIPYEQRGDTPGVAVCKCFVAYKLGDSVDIGDCPQGSPILEVEKVWSNPYCGISHLGGLGDMRRASIATYDEFTILQRVTKGCGFSTVDTLFTTVEEAKSAGEEWVRTGD